MDSLIDAGLGANVGRGGKAQAAHQTGAQVADDITVQVGGNQNVKLLRLLHQLHAQGVNNAVICFNGGVILGDLAEGGQEHAVGQLHDIGLMDCSHLFTAVGGSVIKGSSFSIYSMPLYRSSVFSRTITRSTFSKRVGTPGRVRTGRRLA